MENSVWGPRSGLGLGAGVRRVLRASSDWVDLKWSHHVAALRSAAPLCRGRLLDVGCGDKPHAALFLPYVGEYLGIEKRGTFADTAASTRTNGPDLYYEGERLPFDAETFDTVLSLQVLEHTQRPRELAREMSRVLKPSGLLVLSVPFSFRLHEEPHDYFRYTPYGLRAVCSDAGLEIERCEPLGSLWSVLGHKFNTYLGLRVARIGGVAQALGKLGHEHRDALAPRLWTLPWVVPAMAATSLGARLFDRFFPDAQESLGYLVVARRTRRFEPQESLLTAQ